MQHLKFTFELFDDMIPKWYQKCDTKQDTRNAKLRMSLFKVSFTLRCS